MIGSDGDALLLAKEAKGLLRREEEDAGHHPEAADEQAGEGDDPAAAAATAEAKTEDPAAAAAPSRPADKARQGCSTAVADHQHAAATGTRKDSRRIQQRRPVGPRLEPEAPGCGAKKKPAFTQLHCRLPPCFKLLAVVILAVIMTNPSSLSSAAAESQDSLLGSAAADVSSKEATASQMMEASGGDEGSEPSDGDESSESTNHVNYRPHILMVVMDDLGSNDLGMHGTGIRTPVADDLAETGLFMNNYYVLPNCSPTRMSILSGRYPYAMGWFSYVRFEDTQGMPLDEETLPQVLSRAGYRRHGVGKWHVGHSKDEYLPTFRGFQSWYGYHPMGGGDHFKHNNGKKGGGYAMWHDKREFCGRGCSRIVDERGNYTSDIFAREAIHIIQNHNTMSTDKSEKEPLFLYLAFWAVHKPIQVPEKYIAQYKNKNWSKGKKAYAGMLTAADESLGRVISALKENGLWDDTLVIYTSDNGGLGPPYGSNEPHRGFKASAWEGGVVSDGIISGPARSKLGIKKGQFNHLFHSVDWLPTLAAITKTRPDGKKLHGVSQLAALRGSKASRTELFLGYDVDKWKEQRGSGYLKRPPITALRSGKWKLRSNSRSGSNQLFNLKKDPKECHNVARKHPKIVKALKSKMNGFLFRFSKAVQRGDSSCRAARVYYATPWGDKADKPWCS